jgi:hypothetical protein
VSIETEGMLLRSTLHGQMHSESVRKKLP